MDLGHYNPVTKSRNSYSSRTHVDKTEITDIEEHSFNTVQSSPKCYPSTISKHDSEKLPFSYPRSEYAESLYNDYTFCPNYMSNTESSKAKARSHSAPKQRPVESTYERQLSNKRRPSLEGRNVPRAVRMQISSSHVGATAKGYKYPWSVKLDKSTVSLKDSECGTTSTMCLQLRIRFIANFSWDSMCMERDINLINVPANFTDFLMLIVCSFT